MLWPTMAIFVASARYFLALSGSRINAITACVSSIALLKENEPALRGHVEVPSGGPDGLSVVHVLLVAG